MTDEQQIMSRFIEELDKIDDSKKNIADKIGFSSQTFTNIKKGKNMPSVILLSRLRQYYPSFDSVYVVTGKR